MKWLVSDPTPDSHTTFKEVSAPTPDQDQDPVSDLVSDPATLVLFFVSSLCNFCPPGSGSGFRIRIRIHWHDWVRTRISFSGFLLSCLYYLRYGIIVFFTSVFQDKKPIRSHNTVEISSVEKLFCLLMEGPATIRILRNNNGSGFGESQKHVDSTNSDPEHWLGKFRLINFIRTSTWNKAFYRVLNPRAWNYWSFLLVPRWQYGYVRSTYLRYVVLGLV